MKAFVVVFHSPNMSPMLEVCGVVLAANLDAAQANIIETINKHNNTQCELAPYTKGEWKRDISRGDDLIDNVVAHQLVGEEGADQYDEVYLVVKNDFIKGI